MRPRIDPGDDFEGAIAQIAEAVIQDLKRILPPGLSPVEVARRRLAMAGRRYEHAIRMDIPVLIEEMRRTLDTQAREFVALLDADAKGETK